MGDLIEVRGLLDIPNETKTFQLPLDACLCTGGHDNDRHMWMVQLHIAKKLISVHAGHPEIRYHDIHYGGFQYLHRPFSVVGSEDLQFFGIQA